MNGSRYQRDRWLAAILLGLLSAQIHAQEPESKALDCETRDTYIESLQQADDPHRQRLGRLFAEPDAQYCQTIRVRVTPERDFDWDLSLPGLSALAWLVRGIAVLLLLAGCIWLLLNWRRARPVLARTSTKSRQPRLERKTRPGPLLLPDDIPAAALATWNDGHPRLAVSLLYRGAVKALLPEQDARAATEAEVLQAIQQKNASPETEAWMRQLVGAWQQIAWASQGLSDTQFATLIQSWAQHCGRPAR